MTLRFFALANLDAALAERNCECLRGGRDASPALRDIERAFARAAGRDDVTDDDDEEAEEEEDDESSSTAPRPRPNRAFATSCERGGVAAVAASLSSSATLVALRRVDLAILYDELRAGEKKDARGGGFVDADALASGAFYTKVFHPPLGFNI
jgi:hypothetical protein